tara:strand:+ start:1255 stop:1566 length:312 start_codon:yes stop_codon:yes gene_type:complete
MFVPLVPYHAGGGAASFAPTDVHATEYEWALAQYFGFGVLPCWRGPRLYDSPATQRLVAKWVSFYKTHRAHVESKARPTWPAAIRGSRGRLAKNGRRLGLPWA